MTHDEHVRPCEYCQSNNDVEFCKWEGRYLCRKCSEIWELDLSDLFPVEEKQHDERINHLRTV
jgi:transcription initiation factor TFIIIB Brf1 subunit/transcription initiation factor TFIIB